jgi:DNA-binding SARP family transcriptional activator
MPIRNNDIEFSVLGNLEIRASGRPVEIRGVTGNRLAGALLLHPNTWLPENKLTELVWDDVDTTRNALHCAIARLRRLLSDNQQPTRIQYSQAGYRIVASPDQLDSLRFAALYQQAATADPADRFDLLIHALRLWRGNVLANVSDALSPCSNAVSLKRARLSCACELADLATRLGQEDAALPLVEELALAEPFDEPVQASLMLLLGGSGRRAAGLHLYDRIRRNLANELGVDPSHVLEEAFQILLTGSVRPTVGLPGLLTGPRRKDERATCWPPGQAPHDAGSVRPVEDQALVARGEVIVLALRRGGLVAVVQPALEHQGGYIEPLDTRQPLGQRVVSLVAGLPGQVPVPVAAQGHRNPVRVPEISRRGRELGLVVPARRAPGFPLDPRETHGVRGHRRPWSRHKNHWYQNARACLNWGIVNSPRGW